MKIMPVCVKSEEQETFYSYRIDLLRWLRIQIFLLSSVSCSSFFMEFLVVACAGAGAGKAEYVYIPAIGLYVLVFAID